MKKVFSILLVVMLAFAMLPTGSVLADDLTPPTLGPIASAVVVTPAVVLLNGQVVVTATVDDSTTGGSLIQSAEYSLDTVNWFPMTAVDGDFDAISEVVTATFTAATLGLGQVCVRGTDVVENVGAAVCTPFTTNQYAFKGFKSPVRMGVANKATAGQTIPLKWQLTDANGKPVSDKASFEGVWSYQVDCATPASKLSSAVRESYPGKSGLKYTGGSWHFNWKTPKAYAGNCRNMFVAFNGGQTSPEVLFTFKAIKPKK
ncbi:MAG: PxKF domain-containing protein [Chloroflexi bacterium]|nr:PxKF domain-containing protein [Chloroflexota bacterium]